MGKTAVLVLTAFAVLGCHGPRPGASHPTIRIAIHREPVAFLPVRAAAALGYDQNEGVTVDFSEVAGGAKAMEALLGGSVDVAAASMSDVMLLAAEGGDVRAFFLIYTRPLAVVAVAPARHTTIRTIGDLRGHRVGVSAPGSWTHQFLNFLLVAHGVSPDDVATVSVGMSASSIAALEHGSVDATVLLSSAIPAFEERHPETTFLADTRTAEGARQVFGSDTFPSLGLVARESWLRTNTATAQRLVRAMTRGVQWVRDHSPEEAREMIPVDARMSDNADLQSIRRMQQALSADGRIPPDSLELVQRFVAASKVNGQLTRVAPATVYTNEFTSAK